MSRGPGRVMRGIVEALEQDRRASTSQLCRAVFADLSGAALASTRRALKNLVRRNVLSSIGFNIAGERVYCFASEREQHICFIAEGPNVALWNEEYGALGRRYRAGFVRLMNSAMKNPMNGQAW